MYSLIISTYFENIVKEYYCLPGEAIVIRKQPLTANFYVTIILWYKSIKYFISHDVIRKLDSLIARIAPHSQIETEKNVGLLTLMFKFVLVLLFFSYASNHTVRGTNY